MITAEAARSITNSSIAASKDSPLLKYAIDQIERYVKDVSSRGGRSFSLNVETLAPGYSKPDLRLRNAVGEELRKNGFPYCEIQRSPNCVWFEVSW